MSPLGKLSVRLDKACSRPSESISVVALQRCCMKRPEGSGFGRHLCWGWRTFNMQPSEGFRECRCPNYTNPTDYFMMLMKNEESSGKLLRAWRAPDAAALSKQAPLQAQPFSKAEVCHGGLSHVMVQNHRVAVLRLHKFALRHSSRIFCGREPTGCHGKRHLAKGSLSNWRVPAGIDKKPRPHIVQDCYKASQDLCSLRGIVK